MLQAKRRLLTISHSYGVALNRRLAHEMAQVGSKEWDVTVVAPSFMHGDLRPIRLEKLPDEQCHLEPVNTYLSKQIHVMFYGLRLREILHQSWDLVHCWEEPYVMAGWQVATWTKADTPFVFWTAQNLSKNYPPPFSWAETYCLDRCAGWLACGNSVVEALLPRGYERKPYRVMPLGVEATLFCPNPEAGKRLRLKLGWSDSQALVIGYLGKFVPQKGISLLTQALDSLEVPWRALFVGVGPLEDYLRKWGSRYGDRVRIITNVTHDRVPEYLNAMDVLCAPSQTLPTAREQQGRMIIEAFACGVPVIASDSGEMPYVVGDAGVIVGEKDEAGWSCALRNLLDSPAQRTELAAAGLERARTIYAWPVIARQHLDFFTELLDQRNGGTK